MTNLPTTTWLGGDGSEWSSGTVSTLIDTVTIALVDTVGIAIIDTGNAGTPLADTTWLQSNGS